MNHVTAKSGEQTGDLDPTSGGQLHRACADKRKRNTWTVLPERHDNEPEKAVVPITAAGDH